MSRSLLTVALAGAVLAVVTHATMHKPHRFNSFHDFEHLIKADGTQGSSSPGHGGRFEDSHGFVEEVTQLPGWPDHKDLPSRLFTGYANLTKTASPNTTMMMHYLVYLSEGNHTEDPVLVWFNGGPGATSAWGLFVENGPLMLNEASLLGPEYAATGVPQLVLNPYRWTTFATLIVLAAPPPIGFSYCTPPGPPGNGTACGTWNDTRCGIADAEALGIVFNYHLPTLLHANPSTKLFMMGESYAGVFISETLMEMYREPHFSSITQHLVGVGLGDACLGSDILCGANKGLYSYLLFMYGHGQFPTVLWTELNTKCTMHELTHDVTLSPACKAVVQECEDAVGGFYAYNLYDQCSNNMFAPWLPNGHTHRAKHPRHHQVSTNAPSHAPHNASTPAPFDGAQPFVNLDGYWCPGHVFDAYFKLDAVRAAFKVPQDSFFFNADNAVGMRYIFNEKSVLPFYETLLKEQNIHLLAYNGDADPAVNMFDTEAIWYGFAQNYSMTSAGKWRPFTIGDNMVGGSVTAWSKRQSTGVQSTLWYVTIRGSGHMVPEYRPVAAKTLTENWLMGSELPKYTKPHH